MFLIQSNTFLLSGQESIRPYKQLNSSYLICPREMSGYEEDDASSYRILDWAPSLDIHRFEKWLQAELMPRIKSVCTVSILLNYGELEKPASMIIFALGTNGELSKLDTNDWTDHVLETYQMHEAV